MDDANREKLQNEDKTKEKQQESIAPKMKSSSYDTSSSDSDFDFEFTCDVCNKTFSGVKPLRQHEKSAKHLKRLRKIEVKKELFQKLEEDPVESEEDQTVFAICKTCKKDFMGPESLQQHLKSRSHQKKMATTKLLKELTDKDGHINLKKLKKKRKEEKSEKGIPLVVGKTSDHSDDSEHLSGNEGARGYFGLTKSSGDSSDDDVETQEFECLDCKKVFSGVEPWYQHVVSKVHEKALKQKELIDKLKISGKSFPNKSSIHQYLVQEENDVIFCRLCNVAFSGPESAGMHLKSKKHTKNLELKRWKKTMKDKREGMKSSLKKNADFTLSVECSSEVNTNVHMEETAESKTDPQNGKHPNEELSSRLDDISGSEIKSSTTMEKSVYLEASNSVEICTEEGREMNHNVNSYDDQQKQLESSLTCTKVGPSEEVLEDRKNNLTSFKETSI